jgi:hypothetical protein
MAVLQYTYFKVIKAYVTMSHVADLI